MAAGNYQANYDTFDYNLSEGNLSTHVRALLDSVMGVYGGLYVLDGSTQQDDPGTSGSKLTCWTAASSASGLTCDYTNNQITVLTTGIYQASFQASFQGTTGSTIRFRLRVDDVEQDYGCSRKVSSADVGSASFICPGISLTAGDVVSIYVECDGATDDVTVIDAQFGMRLIG